MSIQAYTDGSCQPNPGPGGWAWIWFQMNDSVVFVDSGGDTKTTNNRMELLAIIRLLQNLNSITNLKQVEIHSDSQYVIKSLVASTSEILKFSSGFPMYTGYAKRWNLPTKTRSNSDLWNDLHLELKKWSSKKTKLRFSWVKGHSNSDGNNLVDKLAKEATPKIKS